MIRFTNLIIEQTPKTPQIDLNKYTGDLIFSGRSTPEDAAIIYEPVLNWVEKYIKAPRPFTNVRLKLDFFNTTTALWLAKVLKLIFSIEVPDHVLLVHLYLPLDEYESIRDFDDIRDAFIPISDILHEDIHNLGIMLYGMDGNDKILSKKLIVLEAILYVNAELS